MMAMARYGLTPETTASRVTMMLPNAMTRPQDRSMPPVRMTIVCPMASTPTTAVCWTISDIVLPVRKRSDLTLK